MQRLPTIEQIQQISNDKNEPKWMLDLRLDSLEAYHSMPMPSWGPDLSALKLEDLIYYVNPETSEQSDWVNVPEEIKNTFEKLGIPKAERDYLGGVGAQYDSGMVYHKILDNLSRQGVVFENMDRALHKYPDLVKEHFAKCIKYNEHKFSALHYACWSGGTFIYVPKGVKVKMPLQAYFRMNKEKSAQFEHTLIIADEGSEIEYIEGCSAPRYNYSSLHAGGVEVYVKAGARVRYSSIESWSKNVFNLNTKKALVYDDASIDWLNGNMGSCVTMLYPTSVLLGDNSKSESLGIVMASDGQVQDTGSKVIHVGKNTSSIIKSKSVSKGGGISNYRGYVHTTSGADYATSIVECDAMILDDISVSNTWPSNKIESQHSSIAHEAKVGKVNDDELFYFALHGLGAESAKRAIVHGFMSEVSKALPLEYAIELNRLIDLEMDNNL